MPTPTCESSIWPLQLNLHVGGVSFGYALNPVYCGMVPGPAQMSDVTTGKVLIDLVDSRQSDCFSRHRAGGCNVRRALMRRRTRLVSKQVNKGIAKIFRKYPKVPKDGFQK